MKFDILTLFPEMFEPIKQSVIGKAVEKELIEINLINIRDFSKDKHKKVDDTVYGGGAGMLIRPDVVYDAFQSIEKENDAKVIYLSPKGKLLSQEKVEELSKEKHLILLCGHYEGIDQRVIDEINPEEISIGDYVVTGGEMPAMILADAISRMLPGVLSQPEGFMGESHYSSLLEYPQYTKPPVWHDVEVPAVLSSGHHANIKKWQRERAIERTLERRPELLNNAELTKKELAFLDELRKNKASE